MGTAPLSAARPGEGREGGHGGVGVLGRASEGLEAVEEGVMHVVGVMYVKGGALPMSTEGGVYRLRVRHVREEPGVVVRFG